jgi:4-amino-4-deoxy-L-arabinose transferase-like glycosyltransferase
MLIMLAVCVRGGVLVAGGARFQDDPDGYRQLARNLLDHGTFGYTLVRDGQREIVPTAYRPPVYPLVLAAAGMAGGVGTLAVALLHLVLGVATVVLVYAVAIGPLGSRVASVAAVLVTFDPILLNQSVLVMTETIAAGLAAGAWLLLSRDALLHRPLALRSAGLVLGIAALCRPVFLVWLVLAAIVVLASAARQRRWHGALGFCLCAAVVLAPWIMRNFRQFQRPIVTTTHGGYTLWLGNNEEYYAFLSDPARSPLWDSAELDDRYNRVKESLDRDEVAADRWARQQAMQCIQRQPLTFVHACIARIGRLWGFVPNRLTPNESVARRAARWAVGFWYLAVTVLVLFAASCLKWRLLQTPWLWGVLLCVSLTAVHSVYWTDLRMRAPAIPFLCVAAAWGAVRLWEQRRRLGGW